MTTCNSNKRFPFTAFKNKAAKVKSSYLEGTASIKPKPLAIKAPPRTTSLKFRTILLSSTPPSPLRSMFPEATANSRHHPTDIEDFEEIDLNAATEENVGIDDDCRSTITRSSGTDSGISISSSSSSSSSASSSSASSPVIEGGNSIDTVFTNILLSQEKHSSKSSLSKGCASILLHNDHNEQQQQQQQQHSVAVFDNGKEELLLHGIPVKEIRSTLAPMIIPSAAHTQSPHYQHQYHHHHHSVKHASTICNISKETTALTSMPSMFDISLQRPEFARVYY